MTNQKKEVKGRKKTSLFGKDALAKINRIAEMELNGDEEASE